MSKNGPKTIGLIVGSNYSISRLYDDKNALLHSAHAGRPLLVTTMASQGQLKAS